MANNRMPRKGGPVVQEALRHVRHQLRIGRGAGDADRVPASCASA